VPEKAAAEPKESIEPMVEWDLNGNDSVFDRSYEDLHQTW
jgi:hypothetical protein